MTGERERRVGHNQALFRQLNDRIEELNASFATVSEVFEVVCECGRSDCMEQITVAPDVYERVRAQPAWFIMRPGHEAEDVERVIEEHNEFVVVMKHAGAPQRLAEDTDPRQR